MRKKTTIKQQEDVQIEAMDGNIKTFTRWTTLVGLLLFLVIVGTVIAVVLALQDNNNGQGVPPRVRRQKELVKIEMQIGEKRRIVPLLSTDERGIPTNLTEEDLKSMDVQMKIPVLGGEGTEVLPVKEGEFGWIEGADNHYIKCPYCNKGFIPKKKELNCHVFRCGGTGVVSPHAKFGEVYRKKKDGSLGSERGCGGPFEVVKNQGPGTEIYGRAVKCSYDK